MINLGIKNNFAGIIFFTVILITSTFLTDSTNSLRPGRSRVTQLVSYKTQYHESKSHNLKGGQNSAFMKSSMTMCTQYMRKNYVLSKMLLKLE